MRIRYSKILPVLSAAPNLSLITLNNLLDYDSNFQFVQHVQYMDDTFPNNRLMWRGTTRPIFHHLLYGVIIVWGRACYNYVLEGDILLV